MITEKMPEYPLYGESRIQFERWYFSRFDNLPSEKEIRQWRQYTFKNILELPLLGCKVLPTGDELVRALDSIPPTRFAGFRPTPSLN